MGDTGGRHLVEQLSKSRIYQDYESAFGGATGLPLALRPVELWQPAHRNKKRENPFCALMGAHSRTCAACLRAQEELSRDTGQPFKTVTCFAGMCDSAVPIRVGAELIGFLQTGQVRTQEPTRKQFLRVARQLMEWGLKVDLSRLEEAYFHTRVLTPQQYESVLSLLAIFGRHLALISNQLLIQHQNTEPPAVARAKQFIDEHQADDLSLSSVAHAVNTSTFYFCKLFKKATGLHFTDYLSRVRVEKAKNLLLNPNARVSEIAYDVGFQSLTHFNRVFKRIVGESPSDYRENLPTLG